MEEKRIDETEKVQQPKIIAIKSRRLLKSIKERESTFKFYSWDIIENYTYIAYLTNFRYIFESQAERKRIKVFRHLSKLIKTRNPHQIKSHHQKMILRHQSIDAIIEFLREKITKELNTKPQYIAIIEKINRQAEQFFIKELGIRTLKKYKNQERINVVKAQDIPTHIEASRYQIKVEQGPIAYHFPQIKEQTLPDACQIIQCMKEEERQDMILRINN